MKQFKYTPGEMREQRPDVLNYGIKLKDFYDDRKEFDERDNPKSYPVLPEHHAHFSAKEIWNEGEFDTDVRVNGLSMCEPHPTTTYAIPRKEEDDEVWLGLITKIWVANIEDKGCYDKLLTDLKQHYTITSKN